MSREFHAFSAAQRHFFAPFRFFRAVSCFWRLQGGAKTVGLCYNKETWPLLPVERNLHRKDGGGPLAILQSYYQDVYKCPVTRLPRYSGHYGLESAILAYLDFGGATGTCKDGVAEACWPLPPSAAT